MPYHIYMMYLQIQSYRKVVTCMSLWLGSNMNQATEALFESQSKDEGRLQTAKQWIKNMGGGYIWPLTFWKLSRQEPQKGTIKQSRHFLLILKPWCQSQRFNRRHISDTPYLWPYLQTPEAIGGEQASIPGAQSYVPFGISSTYLLQIPYLSLSCTVCDSEIWVFVDRNS